MILGNNFLELNLDIYIRKNIMFGFIESINVKVDVFAKDSLLSLIRSIDYHDFK